MHQPKEPMLSYRLLQPTIVHNTFSYIMDPCGHVMPQNVLLRNKGLTELVREQFQVFKPSWSSIFLGLYFVTNVLYMSKKRHQLILEFHLKEVWTFVCECPPPISSLSMLQMATWAPIHLSLQKGSWWGGGCFSVNTRWHFSKRVL